MKINTDSPDLMSLTSQTTASTVSVAMVTGRWVSTVTFPGFRLSTENKQQIFFFDLMSFSKLIVISELSVHLYSMPGFITTFLYKPLYSAILDSSSHG